LPHLECLGHEAAKFGPVFRDTFPIDTQKAQERFELLDRAYIGARYRKDFVVFWGDVEYLAPRVKTLLETAATICRREIAGMGDPVKSGTS
jgi:uncharacterized protein